MAKEVFGDARGRVDKLPSESFTPVTPEAKVTVAKKAADALWIADRGKRINSTQEGQVAKVNKPAEVSSQEEWEKMIDLVFAAKKL